MKIFGDATVYLSGEDTVNITGELIEEAIVAIRFMGGTLWFDLEHAQAHVANMNAAIEWLNEEQKSASRDTEWKHLQTGQRVQFNGSVSQSQISWGSHRDPRGVLTAGQVYTVSRVEVHSWHTKVFLEGFDEKDRSFNSVWLTPVEGI